jgi:hypothetical protein
LVYFLFSEFYHFLPIAMSLTSLLEQNADVRARFLAQFKKPEFRIKSPLLAPPLTEHFGLAGTAFDYLLRFYIQRLNTGTYASDWIAESGLALIFHMAALRFGRRLNAYSTKPSSAIVRFCVRRGLIHHERWSKLRLGWRISITFFESA